MYVCVYICVCIYICMHVGLLIKAKYLSSEEKSNPAIYGNFRLMFMNFSLC